MSAADLLRQALADAPDGLHVAPDGHGGSELFDSNNFNAVTSLDGWESAMRLIGLLLAAAPHLAAMLNLKARHEADPTDIDAQEYTLVTLDTVDNLAAAITEAAQTMEGES